MEHFKDEVAIVTGGASGIGRALCEELNQRGAAAIIVADIDAERAQLVISLVTDKMVFVGDTLFAGSIGRTDFEDGPRPL
ncbi:MAG: SDR family NAD(P)-dependent oxidoreductase [Desulfobacterales bacterium]|nr:SDR family NAD(P)-dependent oxidoreductase [Desulfobacterales bacterium]